MKLFLVIMLQAVSAASDCLVLSRVLKKLAGSAAVPDVVPDCCTEVQGVSCLDGAVSSISFPSMGFDGFVSGK